MVLALRSGQSIRSVAEQFRVNKSTVERWKRRTKGKRIDRIDGTDQADGPPRPANRSSEELEQCVLNFRKQLKEESVLGEHGADAILCAMQKCECPNLPSTALVNRILRRHGAFDGRVRKRRTPPPPGWYFRVDFLALARKNTELDQFDYVEDLCIQGGTFFNVLNVVSLHGGLAGSWPMNRMTTENTVRSACLSASSKTLIEHWTEFGLPDLDYSAVPRGKVIFIRRSTDQEHVEAMGRHWIVKGAGAHKLVRADVDLTANEISFHRLRRSNPSVHECLGVAEYHFPKRKFNE